MIKEILKEISNAKVLDTSKIAKKLNITEVLVEEGIDQLSRMGYVIEDMGSYSCETKCSSCPMANCNSIPLKTLSITEKGQKVLEGIKF